MTGFLIDYERKERLGFPEIVYGEGKDADLIGRIFADYERNGRDLLITRISREKLGEYISSGVYDPVARTFSVRWGRPRGDFGCVVVISGGASDGAVVAETVRTLEFLDCGREVVSDVGVAGVHRLMARRSTIEQGNVLIVIAGFEAALASLVAGLFPQPVIGVPTSVGYGVAAGGRTALNSMLASCANGLAVMNIDNGCGAAVAAFRILRGLEVADRDQCPSSSS